jgi:uncharacterized protein
MKCPKCAAQMEPVHFQHIEVDRCTQCHGLWFDMLEEQNLRKLAGSESIDIGSPSLGRIHNEITDVICPRCGTPMSKMIVHGQAHLWYESCDHCFGVYFDAGEFREYKEQAVVATVESVLLKTGS